MITGGTPDEIKESVLGNLAWRADIDVLKRVRKCFEAQALAVEAVTVKEYSCGRGLLFQRWSVVAVAMRTKREIEGAMAKVLRATKASRLVLYQFTAEGKDEAGLNSYHVELRAAP